jgi:hypothetical protein
MLLARPCDPASAPAITSSSALVVVGPADGERDIRCQLESAADVATLRLSVAAVALVPLFVQMYAPLSGATTVGELSRDAATTARAVASRVAERLGADATTVALGWHGVAALLRDHPYEVVIVTRAPRRRRAVRMLVDAAARSRTALIFAPSQ